MASSFNATGDLSDLTGKVALITGATSGIGFAVAQGLLRKGATVYLAARNESKAIATITRLEAEGLGPGNGKPIWHKLDLDNPHDVKKSAEDFTARESRLDILVNNAAMVDNEYVIGPIGVQRTVTVNYISPFLFTQLVLPMLKKTAQNPDSDVRIVNVCSDAYRFISKAQLASKADLNGPNTKNEYWSQFKRYAFSKLLDILWSNELARHLAVSTEDGGADILCLAVHPGAVATEGTHATFARYPWPISSLFHFVVRLTFITSAKAAATVLIAAAQPDLQREKEKFHGAYLVPVGKLTKLKSPANDERLAKDLWALTEEILAEEGL